jgi:hypothetical protein
MNPGVHVVPADARYTDRGAGGAYVTEVRFLVPVEPTATIKLSGIAP